MDGLREKFAANAALGGLHERQGQITQGKGNRPAHLRPVKSGGISALLMAFFSDTPQ
jgi:hypothetical protein